MNADRSRDRVVGRHRTNGRLIFQAATSGRLYYLDNPPIRVVGLHQVILGDAACDQNEPDRKCPPQQIKRKRDRQK
jgi:hypothetical protein